MEKNLRKYDGVQIINCSIDDDVVIGQDTFVKDCVLGKHVQLNRRNLLENVKIGHYSYTGPNTVIKTAEIGKYCSISWNVSITGNRHEYLHLTVHPIAQIPSFGVANEFIPHEQRKILIGNDVWIAANASIMPGVRISVGAIVGAGSVVTKNVPPYAIVAGNPARIIKYRFPEECINRLLNVRWCDWPEDIIKENIHLFQKEMDEKNLKRLEEIQKTLD